MKKSKILLALMMILILVSCTKEKSELRIGLNADYPPFEYKEAEVLTGLDVELAKKVCETLGYKCKFVELEFDELLPALDENKIDLAISAMTINAQREQLVDFSIPYFCADQAFLSLADKEIEINELADISDYQIGVQNGTTGQYYLQYNMVEKDLLSWEKLTPYDNNNQAISALLNKEVDLLIMDDSAAEAFSAIKPLKIIHIVKTYEQYGIAMRKGYENKGIINDALQQILGSSFWNELITQYMGK